MKRFGTVFLTLCVLLSTVSAQYPPFTKWYQNPLGFKPVNLHTANGIILPAIAAGVGLLLTKKDSTVKKRLSFYTDAGFSKGYYASRTMVYQNDIGVLFRMRKFLSIGVEWVNYHVSDEVNNTWGFGLRPFARFYPVRKENFSLFFQSGAGLIYFLKEFPQPSGFFGDNRMGTKWNGCPKYGMGSEFRLGKIIVGRAGFWHVHVSNGDYPGFERNPGHDSNGITIGLGLQ